jgi:hypothetical protein
VRELFLLRDRKLSGWTGTGEKREFPFPPLLLSEPLLVKELFRDRRVSGWIGAGEKREWLAWRSLGLRDRCEADLPEDCCLGGLASRKCGAWLLLL